MAQGLVRLGRCCAVEHDGGRALEPCHLGWGRPHSLVAHRRRRLPPLAACRQAASGSFAPVPPPEHPTYDVYAAIQAALDEDAGDLGDITTLST